MKTIAILLGLGFFATACVDDTLVSCDDVLCPAGHVCAPSGACAKPEQVAACAQLGGGDACQVASGGVGFCDDGICEITGCGDGEVSGAEQCDGEVIAGAPSCIAAGYYDGEVGCATTCQLELAGCSRRCGDGILDADKERCDGAGPVGMTCLDFGYDLGSLGCTSVCTEGLSECGRFGWDRYHVPTAPSKQATQLFARDTRVAMLFAHGVDVLDQGLPYHKAGSFDAIAGTTDAIYAISNVATWKYTAGTWTQLPAILGTPVGPGSVPPAPTPVVTAWAGPEGLFAMRAGTSVVWHLAGTTWTSLPLGATLANPRFGSSHAVPRLVDNTDGAATIWMLGAGTSSFASLPVAGNVSRIYDIADGESETIGGWHCRIATDQGLLQIVDASGIGLSSLDVADPRELYFTSTRYLDIRTASGYLVRLDEFTVALPPDPVLAIAELGGVAFAAVPAGVFALEKGEWTDLGVHDDLGALHGKPEPVAVAGAELMQVMTGGLAPMEQFPVPAAVFDSLVLRIGVLGLTTVVTGPGVGTQPVAMAFQMSMVAFDNKLQRRKAGLKTDYPVVHSNPRALWGDVGFAGTGGLVVAVGRNVDPAGDIRLAEFRVSPPLLTEPAIPGTTGGELVRVDGNDEVVYAAGHRNGAGLLVKRENAVWSVVDDHAFGPLADVAVGDGGASVFAVGGDKLYLKTNGAWSTVDVPGATLTSVAVSRNSTTDVFFAGKAGFGFEFQGLGHYDGTRVTMIRLPMAKGRVKDVYAEKGRVLLVIEDDHGIDHVYSLARTTTW